MVPSEGFEPYASQPHLFLMATGLQPAVGNARH